MKNLRKDAILGIILLGLWLVITCLFQGYGIFLWLLGVGLLPDPLHQKVMDLKNKLLKSAKK